VDLDVEALPSIDAGHGGNCVSLNRFGVIVVVEVNVDVVAVLIDEDLVNVDVVAVLIDEDLVFVIVVAGVVSGFEIFQTTSDGCGGGRICIFDVEDEVEEEENEDSTSIAFVERSIIQIFGFSLTFGFSLEQMEHDRC